MVDLGPGSGIDVFLYANNVKESGTAIDIDLTYEMLQRAKNIAQQAGYSNVEFRRAISLDNWLLDQSLLDRQGNRNSASAILRLQI